MSNTSEKPVQIICPYAVQQFYNKNDPWHKLTYKRIVRNFTVNQGGEKGLVRLPFSSQPIEVRRNFSGASSFGAWIVQGIEKGETK